MQMLAHHIQTQTRCNEPPAPSHALAHHEQRPQVRTPPDPPGRRPSDVQDVRGVGLLMVDGCEPWHGRHQRGMGVMEKKESSNSGETSASRGDGSVVPDRSLDRDCWDGHEQRVTSVGHG